METNIVSVINNIEQDREIQYYKSVRQKRERESAKYE